MLRRHFVLGARSWVLHAPGLVHLLRQAVRWIVLGMSVSRPYCEWVLRTHFNDGLQIWLCMLTTFGVPWLRHLDNSRDPYYPMSRSDRYIISIARHPADVHPLISYPHQLYYSIQFSVIFLSGKLRRRFNMVRLTRAFIPVCCLRARSS